MNKFLLAGAAGVALLASGMAVAHNHGGKMMDIDGNGEVTRAEATSAAESAFAQMDSNKDGVLNEADRAAHMGDQFAIMDTNKDGQLTKSELEAAHAARRNDRGGPMGERGERQMADRTDAQKAEWQAKMTERQDAHFAAMDTDKNGTLSQAEFTAGHAKMAKGEGERMGKRGKHGGMDPEMMMKRADTNGDKAVSKAEFTVAALARFDRMDSDKNGVISASERQAMKGKHGKHAMRRGMGSDGMGPDMPPMDGPPPPPSE